MGCQDGQDEWQGGDWWTRCSHSCMWINQEEQEQLGSKRLHNPGFQLREIKLQNLLLKKPVGVEAAGETPSLTGEVVGETTGS